MTDHDAAIVREALIRYDRDSSTGFSQAALAALDVLEADLEQTRFLLEQALQAGEDRVRDLAAARQTLRHVWGCPYEPFACSDPLHAKATELVAALAEADA